MNDALIQFKENIIRIKKLENYYDDLEEGDADLEALSDILRAELVFAVSAFDYYIHELVRIGLKEAFLGGRPKTNAYKNFQISLNSVPAKPEEITAPAWLDNEIRARNNWKTFQHSTNLGDALKLITDKRVWDEIAPRIGKTPEETRQTLDLIVDRRNKISHEADMDPSYPNTRWPIDIKMVNDAVQFLYNLGENIRFLV